jgi:DNA-directed RNA polymerase subunit M/transcription elongation factor TFIIS
MKAIGGDSDDESSKPTIENKDPSWLSSASGSASVKQSQVDGAIDSWSRSSSISSPAHLSETDDSLEGADKSSGVDNQTVIHKRMKQIQGRPRTKSCLIKHVFSAVAKKRKIVVVRHRKPENRIYDKAEYEDRKSSGNLDEVYDEDTDDPTLKPRIKQPKIELVEPIVNDQEAIAVEDWREDEDYLESLETLKCYECGRSLPNAIRMHAHLQMHRESASKKAAKTEERILQVDGENDLLLDDEDDNALVGPASTSNNTTQLYILKNQDAKVYQCTKCPEVFPGQKALMTHQSLMHHDSMSSTIYPCQQCNVAFRDANSLEIHMRNEHGKQQIVTIIQADLPRSEVGSAGSSFGSSSSSCSSSTTSSHQASSNQYYNVQADGLNVGGQGAAVQHHVVGHHQIGGSLGGLGGSHSNHHPLMMKQDPVLMFNSDEEQDLMLDESLQLFETSSLIDSGDSAIHLSLDDLANFAQPMTTGKELVIAI